jgi:hypothetical protein
MSNRIGILATIAITTASATAIWIAPNAYAQPDEDSPQWSCVDDGNRVCGPGNSEGKPAACYDDGGVIYALWPCEAWKPSDGYRRSDGSIVFSGGSDLATGPNAWDDGAYVGGYN